MCARVCVCGYVCVCVNYGFYFVHARIEPNIIGSPMKINYTRKRF